MRIGILGAGQLGSMLAWAGNPLGLDFSFYDVAPSGSANLLGQFFFKRDLQEQALVQFVASADLFTYGFETMPIEVAEYVAAYKRFFPSLQSLRTSQNRIEEKKLFNMLNIPHVPYRLASSDTELRVALQSLGLPAVVKNATLSYERQGECVIHTDAEIETAWSRMSGSTVIIEPQVPYIRDLSIVAVRGQHGEMAFYPVAENYYDNGVLQYSIAPAADIVSEVQQQIQQFASSILTYLNHVGALTLELLDTEQGILANKLISRVHNSGHWTLDGAETNQFENHLRAILGYPLGSTEAYRISGMVNLIGQEGMRETLFGLPSAHLHLYRKEPRPGQKLGHVNITASTYEELIEHLRHMEPYLSANAPILQPNSSRRLSQFNSSSDEPHQPQSTEWV